MGWLSFGGDYDFGGGGGYDGGYDFGAVEDFGDGYDFGAIEPGYGAYDFGGGYDFGAIEPLPFASEGGYTFDTTTGEIGGGGGVPLTADYLRAGGAPVSLGGGGDVTRPPEGGFFSTANRFLETPTGRIGGALGLGLLGLGAQQLFAGRTPEYRPPAYAPSPVTAAGQAAVLRAMEGGAGPALTEALTYGAGGQRDIARQLTARVGRETLAEEAAGPYEQATRMAALNQVQGLMPPGAEVPIEDPIRAGLRQELLDVLGGQAPGVSPATARRQQIEEQTERARLYRQLGPDYELTTPGQEALRNIRERQNSERFTERQATIARLSPLEESRMRFGTTAPTDIFAAREGLRRSALTDAERLSQFGIRGTPQNVTALSQIVPVQTLLGGDPERAGLINTNLQAQAGMEAYRAANTRQQQLAQGIGGVFGTVAGAVGARPSRLESYYDRILGGNY